jgi:hypothetical protein
VGRSPPRVRFRLTRGSDDPWTGLRLARGLDAPSREAPPRSRAKRPLERVSVSLEGFTGPPPPYLLLRQRHLMHWHLQAPSQRRIHATTRLWIMPRHCSANSRGAAIPATVRRCAAWSAYNVGYKNMIFISICELVFYFELGHEQWIEGWWGFIYPIPKTSRWELPRVTGQHMDERSKAIIT